MKIKELRGQVRQIVKELLPEVMASEATQQIEKKIMERLDKIEKQQKNILGYLLRATSEPAKQIKI